MPILYNTVIYSVIGISCAIANTGELYCWGNNSLGQLGNGTLSNSNIPTLVSYPNGVNSWTKISTAGIASCATAATGIDAGQTYCWGGTGSSYLLGTGSTTGYTPQAVIVPNGVTSWSKIAVSSNSSCMLAENNGQIYCSGNNSNGALGNGSNYPMLTVPTSVTLPNGVSSWSYLSTNANNTTYCALANTGNLYCWGLGTNGQIGNGANLTVDVPTMVTLPSGVTSWTSVATSSNNNCALANNGKLYCWGSGGNGQIGNGINTAIVNVPTQVTLPNGVSSFTSYTSKGDVSCALANTGNLYCWGVGTSGQIGNGANSNVNVPTLVALPSGTSSWTSIYLSAGTATTCGLVNTGNIYCWGVGTSGEIGNGANSNVNVPTLVTKPAGVNSWTSLQLSKASGYLCALANTGNLYCWGSGSSGQLGNGTNLNSNTPSMVTLPNGVNSWSDSYTIDASNGASCAVSATGTNAGRLYCWGNGAAGMLASGTNVSTNIPSLVTGI